ncbi:MAG: AAA family ATPase [Chloroflexi bacterium]|nr:AAA family ATPase [Chloroflexota bacterium]OJV97158.1 MAG: hypothetical protein BGO39_19440 [Chloroflexi bacterium 54-19]
MNYPTLARPLLSKDLIGRETILETLDDLLKQAASGRPQLVLLSGEAGLGKTRLCQGLIEQSRASQGLLLFGQALPQDQTLPFGPFLDAFRRYYSSVNPETQTPPGLSFLLRLIPEIGALFPNVTPVPLDPSGTLALQQSRLFHCVLSGLRELARSRSTTTPLVIILEDLHWADETSLELLAYLARQLGVNAGPVAPLSEEPILILGTYRSEALEENTPFANWLIRTQKQRQLQELHLAPLDQAAHIRLVSNILGQPIPPGQANLLYSRDEGNPFYTEELLGALRAAGHLSRSEERWVLKADEQVDLPMSLKASILERVATLPEEDRQVLTCAAVIGREFDFELLAKVTGLAEKEVLAILRRAINQQLLREGPVNPTARAGSPYRESYHFRHALMGEAIYSDLLARERRHLHLKIAASLENGENPPVRILAEHFALAGQPEKARPYALQEAEKARQVLAYREERHFLEIGLPSLALNSPEQLGTLHRLGLLSLALGDIPATFKWLTRAKEGYEQAGQEKQAALVLINLSFLFWFYDPARLTSQMAQLEKASQVSLNGQDESLEALSVFSHTAFSLASGDMNSQAQVWVGRAFELAAKIPGPAAGGALQFTFLAQGLIQADGPASETENGLAAIQQVVRLALQYNLPELVMLGYGILITALVNLGQYERAGTLKEEIIAYQDRTNSPRMTNLLAWHDFFSGNWEKAEQDLREELEHHPAPTVDALCQVALAHILVARYDLEEVPAMLETAWEKVRFLQIAYRAPALWGFARYYEVSRQPHQAAEYYQKLLDDWQTTEERGLALVFLQDAIEFYVSQDDLWKAGRWLNELTRLVSITGNPVGHAALLSAEGALATAEGRTQDAQTAFHSAYRKWAELKRPYSQARTGLRLARLLLNQPRAGKVDRKEAGELLDETEAILRGLKAKQLLVEIEKLKRETRLEGQSKRRATLAAARTPFEGLTRREIQVLVQVSAGHSNKEIAQNLNITGATVETHLNHILSKLGCDSRTQAVSYAVGKGWLKPPFRAD